MAAATGGSSSPSVETLRVPALDAFLHAHQALLANSIVFADGPAAHALASVGLQGLLEEGRIANIVDLATAVDSVERGTTTQQQQQQQQQRESDSARTAKKSPGPSAGAAADDGWDAELDFVEEGEEEDAAAKEPEEDEKKSTPPTTAAAAAATPTPRPAAPFLPLDLSHAYVADAEVVSLQLKSAAASSSHSTTKQSNTSATAAAPAAADGDEWGWNDEEDAPPKKMTSKTSETAAVAEPSPDAPHRASFVVSGPLTSGVLAKLAIVIAHGRSAPAAFRARKGADVDDDGDEGGGRVFSDVHVFTTTASSGEGAFAYATIAATLVKLVRQQRSVITSAAAATATAVKVQVHFAPLHCLPLSATDFLTPLPSFASAASSSPSSTATATTDASAHNGNSTSASTSDVIAHDLATYPPALVEAPTSLLAGLTTATTTATVAAATKEAPMKFYNTSSDTPSATDEKASSSSSSSLLSGFSISGLAKGLTEHIREAEELAMKGADPASMHSTGGSGGGGPGGASEWRAHTLAHSLAHTLAALRVRPDAFAVGQGTAALARHIVDRVHEIRHEASEREAGEKKAKSKMKGSHRKSQANSDVASSSSSSSVPWRSGSLLLIERSLDVVSVVKHHGPGEIRDRMADCAGATNLRIVSGGGGGGGGDSEDEKDPVSTTLDEITDQLLADAADWTDATADAATFDDRTFLIKRSPLASEASAHAAAAAAATGVAFPPGLAEHSSVTDLLSSIEALGSKKNKTAAAAATNQAVLQLTWKALGRLAEACEIPTPPLLPAPTSSTAKVTAGGAPTAGQLAAALTTTLDRFESDAPHFTVQFRPFLDTVRAITQALQPPPPSQQQHGGRGAAGGKKTNNASSSSSASKKSVYDRLLSFEQLLVMQYISNTSSTSTSFDADSGNSGSGGGATSPMDEDANSVGVRGLAAMVVEFVEEFFQAEEKESTGGAAAASSSSSSSSRLSLLDVLRLVVFLYSLLSGRYTLGETDARALRVLLGDALHPRRITRQEADWVRRACGWQRDQPLTSRLLEDLVSAFFRGPLQSLSLARHDLTAGDLLDLTAPGEGLVEGDTDEAATPMYRSFVERLVRRMQHPDNLLDDLDHLAFEVEADQANGEQSPEATQTNAAATADPSTHAAADSSSSGWGFLGSLASAVTSAVTATAMPLGFSSVARPDQRPIVVVFVVGGVTHAERRRIHQATQAWEAAADAARPRVVLVGSTHIATAHDLVGQLLRAAAAEITV